MGNDLTHDDIFREKGWFVKCRPMRAHAGGGFLAWCAQTHELGDSPLSIPNKYEVLYVRGETIDDAVNKLAQMLAN